MPTRYPPEVERRVLALFERLADRPDGARLRTRLLRNESAAVRTRLSALESSARRAGDAIPTLIPGSADADAATIPPARVGAFRLTQHIGRGGMGDVWAGQRDDGLYEQKVAIKLIQRHALHRAAAAFDDERRFLARLEHPNIARLIDGGVTEDGLPWLVLEYVEGRPIDAAAEGLTDAERVRLIVKAADAVQYAHSRMVAHADLKPSNILVDAQGRVKLLDFGIAALIGGATPSPAGSGPLTREFASPQRIAGEGPSVQDDVYALGRTMGRVLGDSRDRELRAIAAKAHHPDPLVRYGSAAALIADLDRWRARLPVGALPDRWRYRAAKFIARHRTGVFATSIALILLGATSLVATSNYYRAERARVEASNRFEDARGAARYVSADLLGKLAAQPGTLALRGEAATVIQRYLDRLTNSSGASPAVRLDAAEGLLKLAEAQGRPGVPNLGDVDSARANLNRAHALVDGASDMAARRLAVAILLDRARLATYAFNDTAAALADLAAARRLLDRDAGAPALLHGRYFIELASAREWNGEHRAGIAAARLAERTLPGDDARETMIQRSAARDLLAEGIYYSVSPKASIASYRAALAMLEHAAQRYPGDQIVSRKRARAQWALASSLIDSGNPLEALRLLETSSATIRRIVVAEPRDADARRMLRITENARGQALVAVGRVDEGIGLFKANTAERKSLLAARPHDPMRLRDYMVSVKALGDIQTGNGRTHEGCRTYAEARDLIARLDRDGILTGMDRRTRADVENRTRRYCPASA